MKYSIVNIVECGKSIGKGYFLSALRAKMYEYRRYAFGCLDSFMKVRLLRMTCTREVGIRRRE